jgi:hypothetical protein
VSRKDDKLDAQMLARLARVDPRLLRPIRHRSEEAQADLMTIRIRGALVEPRTGLVNAAPGLAKAMGERLPKCDTDQMGEERLAEVPEALAERLKPLPKEVALTFALTKSGSPKAATWWVLCGAAAEAERVGRAAAGTGDKPEAVGTKPAILLHHLWRTGEVYEPLRNSSAPEREKAA